MRRVFVMGLILGSGALVAWPALVGAQDPPRGVSTPGAGAPHPGPRASVAAPGVACASAPRDMVCVSGGTFQMGSTVGDSDELPVHTVTVGAFLIDRTEVTFGAYMQCVKAGRCGMPRYYPPLAQRKVVGEKTQLIKRLPARRRAAAPRGRKGEPAARRAASTGPATVRIKVSTLMVDSALPVAGVTWHDAAHYCEYRGRHLPTEAQWEFAARGSTGNYYAWGSDPPTCERANGPKCGKVPKPASSLPGSASPFGALHMTGNVWEWVHDWYDGRYYAATKGATDPVGPVNVQDPVTGRWKYRYRALRGGSWSGIPNELRTSYRYRLLPTMYANDIGFRCAKSGLTLPTDPTPGATPSPAATPAAGAARSRLGPAGARLAGLLGPQ